MLYAVTYIVSALACAATLFAAGWSHSGQSAALVCAVAAIVAVAVVYAIRPERLADWHRRRARSLSERNASISSIWGPPAWVLGIGLALFEAMHLILAERLGS